MNKLILPNDGTHNLIDVNPESIQSAVQSTPTATFRTCVCPLVGCHHKERLTNYDLTSSADGIGDCRNVIVPDVKSTIQDRVLCRYCWKRQRCIMGYWSKNCTLPKTQWNPTLRYIFGFIEWLRGDPLYKPKSQWHAYQDTQTTRFTEKRSSQTSKPSRKRRQHKSFPLELRPASDGADTTVLEFVHSRITDATVRPSRDIIHDRNTLPSYYNGYGQTLSNDANYFAPQPMSSVSQVSTRGTPTSDIVHCSYFGELPSRLRSENIHQRTHDAVPNDRTASILGSRSRNEFPWENMTVAFISGSPPDLSQTISQMSQEHMLEDFAFEQGEGIGQHPDLLLLSVESQGGGNENGLSLQEISNGDEFIQHE